MSPSPKRESSIATLMVCVLLTPSGECSLFVGAVLAGVMQVVCFGTQEGDEAKIEGDVSWEIRERRNAGSTSWGATNEGLGVDTGTVVDKVEAQAESTDDLEEGTSEW